MNEDTQPTMQGAESGDVVMQATEVPAANVPLLPDGYLDQLLSFLYTIAHWIGLMTVRLLEQFVTFETPANLVDPIGFLVLLTAFLIVTEIAKKLAWVVVITGWVLIVARIALEVSS